MVCAIVISVRPYGPHGLLVPFGRTFLTSRHLPRSDIGEAVNVVRPAVQKNDRRIIGGASLDVSNIENSSIDLLQ
jgi:hypothetical protein